MHHYIDVNWNETWLQTTTNSSIDIQNGILHASISDPTRWVYSSVYIPAQQGSVITISAFAKLVSGGMRISVGYITDVFTDTKTETDYIKITSQEFQKYTLKTVAPKNCQKIKVDFGTSGEIGEGYFHSPTIEIENFGFDPVHYPTLLNGWTNVGGFNETVGFWKSADGMVHIRGQVKNGTLNTSVFTLPTGYRPGMIQYFPVVSNDTFAHVRIESNGDVIIKSGDPTKWISLDGIAFRARK